MHITTQYVGTFFEKSKCAFYLLYEDYIETQTEYVKKLEQVLYRFARNLKENGGVVKPFLEDIEKAKIDILSKNWTEREKQNFLKTPGMLMINVDFNTFNPKKNKWIYFNFNPKNCNIDEVDELLKNICNVINNEKHDIFKEVKKVKDEMALKKAKDMVELKVRN